jgi:hypothetical protein
MSRTVPVSILNALAQPEVQPFYATEMLFDSGAVRLWTGYGDRTIDGEIYIGAGELLQFSGLEEVSDLSARSVTISLSGVAASLVSLALAEPYQRRKCRVLFGVSDVSDYVEVFSGQLNKMTIRDSGESSTIAVLVDSKLIRLERASNRRYTSESQKSRYANDTFFDYVTSIQDAEIVWGRKSS